MNIKNLVILVLFVIVSGCQPEQAKWPENKGIQRSTPGQMVYEALANNIAHQSDCGPERAVILSTNKSLFINKFNKLLNIFSEGDEKEKMDILSTYLKDHESTDQILKIADVLEKISDNIAPFDLKDLKEFLSSNNNAIEHFILHLIHSEDFDKLIEYLADPTKPQLGIIKLSSRIQALIDKFTGEINMKDLSPKILKLIDKSSDFKNVAMKGLKLIEKFSDPATKKAAKELNEIMLKVYPEITTENMLTWIGLLKNSPSALSLPAWATKLLVKVGAWANILPGFLPDFIDRITADEKIYKSLMKNTEILYKAGIFDDILDLIPELEKYKKHLKPEYLDYLRPMLVQAKKLFVPNEPIFEAPVVIIAQVLLEFLATTPENNCAIPNDDSGPSAVIKNWLKSLIISMRDTFEGGLLHILSEIRTHL